VQTNAGDQVTNASFELTYRVTGMFFDKPAVQRRIEAGRRRALETSGAWVRKRAISLLRRRKKVSRPGQTPSIHTDKGAEGPAAGLKFILFAYDLASLSAVVGPVRLNQVVDTTDGTTRVPSLMEFGGTARIHEVRRVQPWRPASYMWRRRDLRRRAKEGEERRIRTAVYGPRPFMGPALRQTLPKLPESCRDLLSPTASVRAA
jgi:hypothetical protein